MKKNYKQCKTRFLLFFLLSLFAGGLSPAWAQVTDDFSSYPETTSGTTLGDNWVIIGSDGNYSQFGTGKDYQHNNSYGDAWVATSSNNNYTRGIWLVLRKQVTGTVSFNATNGYNWGALTIYVSKAVESGNSYAVTGEASSYSVPAKTASEKTYEFDAGDTPTYIAFCLVGTNKNLKMWSVTYTEAVEEGDIDKPTAFTASNITYNTAQLSWTAGGEESAWQLIYSTDASVDKDTETPIDITDNPYTLTSLTPETTYYAYLRAKSGESVSAWTSKISFTTLEKYAKPTDLAVAKQGTNATLTWTAGGAESAWDVAYSTNSSANPDELSATTVNAATCTLSDLTVGTTYYVWVRANHGSEGSGWINTSFALAYSTPAPTSVDGNGITNVTYGSGAEVVNYDTSKSPYYQDNTAQLGAVTAGSETTVAITFSTGYTYGTVVWVDWNQNYEFEDSEIVFAGECTKDKPNTLNATFTVPAEQAAGNYRMRICAADSYYDSHKTMDTAAGADPTPTGTYCVAQDYTLKVKEAAAYAMSVSDTDIAFGTVKNTTTTKTFTIINDGDNALENMSVVSSNNEIFTVSETGFDIPAEGSKVITVTFVKDVAGDYSETITVSQANVDNKVINVTATYEAPTPAAMVITIAEAAVGETVAFGSVGKQAEKTFTITNDGDQTLNITSIVSDNTTDFTVSPENLEVAGHSSETFTVTFVYDAEALNVGKTATITITPSNEGVAPKSFTVTGTCIEQWSEDFSGGSLPEGWEIENSSSSTYWAFNEGYAKGTNNSYYYTYLITPALTVEEGDALSFDIKDLAYGYYRTYIVEKQVKGESGWSAWSEVASYGNADLSADWLTKTISGLAAGTYKFRFKSNSFALDNFQGFKRNQNDPKMGAYTDAECTVAAASSVTKDFGFVTEDATYTYYIKNDGTGTLTLDQNEVPAGFSAVLGKSELAKDESTSLTITFGQISGGYRGGNIVINGNDGSSFTVAVSGVMVDDSKLNLNFATDNIPTTWTANAWTKDGSGHIKTGESGYSNTSMETSTLTAVAGETLVVVAKNGSTSSSYTFGVKYKQVGAEEWSDLIPATNIGTSWKTLTGTIAEAGDYLLQFNGYYASIQRIYGLTEPQEPVMVVYDGESLAGATYDFGNVANDADAEWTLTVKNEGKAVLEGLTAALSGDQAAHYSVEVTGLTDGNLAANATATITVKQLKDNLGTHTATLTISATSEGIADKVITLSGTTRDASKMFVDFSDGSMPEGWTVGTSWTVTSGYAQQSSYNTASALVTTPLTVTEGETLTFQAARYSSYSAAELKARYTMDGGVTWSEYVDYASQITSGSFVTLELTGVPAGTAVVEFYGRYVKLDNISGFVATTAPMFALATSETLTDGKYDFGQSLQAAPADKVFTITNSGNGNLVSTIAATGDVTATLATTDGELSNEDKTVTLEPGETATITVSLIFDASEIGEQNGSVTIDSNEPVADVVLNFTANVLDATAVNIDFSDNSKPAGFYSSGWTFTGGYAANNAATEAELITSKLTVAGTEDVLSYQARTYNKSWYDGTLIVQYSTDRKNWTNVATQPSNLNDNYQTFTVSGLEEGDYYLRFAGSRVHVDNIAGWHFATPVAEHDIFFVSIDVPEGSYVPGSDYTAIVKVANLRAASETVSAELYIKNEQANELTEQVIALDETKEFTLTGIVPEEGKHLAWVKVYNSDITIQTEPVTFTSAHNLTLAISDFARVGDGAIDADENNQFNAAFNVTVQNTGSTEATPVVKIFIGETEVGTATADAAVAAGESKTILVNVTDASAGEGGELEFTAKAYWTAEGEALATSGSNVTITVNAKAPKFALYQDATPVNDGDDVDFGLVKGTTETFSYTIKNEGTAPMELISIVAPEGFETTALTDDNKTIAVDSSLDIDVTLKAEQGKVAGDLIITYKVDAMTDNTFTLALSGRSIAADTWTEDFESGSIPANWTNNGWEWNSDRKAAYSGYSKGHELMTPRLAAEEGEELNFDVIFPYSGEQLKVQYSTDKTNWNDVSTYVSTANNQTFEGSFIAPATGNYYLKFGDSNSRYVYVDNFVGFRLDPLDLILDETASNSFDTANYDNVTLNRAFIAGWNTVCLPFAIDNITAFFGDGAYAYTYTGYNEGDLTFTIVEDAMTAATPYLVFVPAAINSKELKNIAISGEDAGSVGDENATFTGTYDRIVAGKLADKYVLTPNATIQKAGDGAWMNAFRAYFTIPTGLVKALVFDGGTATGVRRIELTGNEDVRDIFDLAGRKLNETRKGINIVNGKKVLVK